MNQDPQTPPPEPEPSVRPSPADVEPSGPVSPPAPAVDHDGDETGGYEKRPRTSSTDNAKGGYGAG